MKIHAVLHVRTVIARIHRSNSVRRKRGRQPVAQSICSIAAASIRIVQKRAARKRCCRKLVVLLNSRGVHRLHWLGRAVQARNNMPFGVRRDPDIRKIDRHHDLLFRRIFARRNLFFHEHRSVRAFDFLSLRGCSGGIGAGGH